MPAVRVGERGRHAAGREALPQQADRPIPRGVEEQACGERLEPSCPALEPSCPALEPSCPALEPSCPALEPSCPALEPSCPHVA